MGVVENGDERFVFRRALFTRRLELANANLERLNAAMEGFLKDVRAA